MLKQSCQLLGCCHIFQAYNWRLFVCRQRSRQFVYNIDSVFSHFYFPSKQCYLPYKKVFPFLFFFSFKRGHKKSRSTSIYYWRLEGKDGKEILGVGCGALLDCRIVSYFNIPAGHALNLSHCNPLTITPRFSNCGESLRLKTAYSSIIPLYGANVGCVVISFSWHW